MSFERQFLLASHALALIGVLGVALTREVGPVYVLFALAALLWSAWRGRGGRGFDLDVRLANAAMVALLAVLIFRIVGGTLSPIRGIAEFLLVLLGLKMLAAKADRDWLQIYVLSFFEVVAASALTIELAFAAVFASFLLFAPWVMTLAHLRREVVAAGDERRLQEEPFVEASLFRAIVGVTLVLFVSTLTVFVFFPRMGAGFFAHPFGRSGGLSGFSDRIELGDVASLQLDDTVAMRVAIDPVDRVRNQPRYWRAAVLDAFDGREWSRGAHRYQPFDRVAQTIFRGPAWRERGERIREEIMLEPMETPIVPSLGRPVELRRRMNGVLADALGNYRGAFPAGVRLRFDVITLLAPDPTPPTDGMLDLPNVDPRIAELAAETTAGLESPVAQAAALLDFFRRGFEYTLEPGDVGAADPLVRFLFETRRGHCEYFASALAVLLRSASIPSRIVNGYHGGDWNEYGGYFVVRQSDAHSWVEAWIDGRWQRFDASPPAVGGAGRARTTDVAAWVDAARMRWYRYVVNYGIGDQIGIALAVRDSSRRLWHGVGETSFREIADDLRGRLTKEPLTLAAVALVGFVAFLAIARLRRRGAGDGGGPVSPATLEYVQMLRVLERRGLRKRPGETAEEFLRGAAPRLGASAGPVAEMTTIYQSARFSGDALLATRSLADLRRLREHVERGGDQPASAGARRSKT